MGSGIRLGVGAEGAVITSATNELSTIVGTAGFVLTANGPGIPPSFQFNAPGDGVETITGDTGGALSGANINFTGGSTGLTFNGAGTTETLVFAGITANGGTVSLATDATTSTINIGTGSGLKTSTFGSTYSNSATIIQAGAGNISLAGGIVYNLKPVSGPIYAITSSDYVISVDSSGGPVTIELPNGPTAGRAFIIKDSTGSAAINNITIITVSGMVLVDGAASFVMNTIYESTTVIFNGTSYLIV